MSTWALALVKAESDTTATKNKIFVIFFILKIVDF